MSKKIDKIDGSIPLKDRAERFVQLYACGKLSASEAFRQAGYAHKGADANSARLTVRDSIKRRLAYIRAVRACKDGITREGQTRKLAVLMERCLANGEHATYVRALEACNRMYGLDKQVIETSVPEPMTRDQAAEADRYAQFRLWEAGQARIKAFPGQSDAKAG